MIQVNKKGIYCKKEEVDSKLSFHIFDSIYKARKDKTPFYVEKNPSELDVKFLNIVFDEKTIPTFFLGKKSSSIRIRNVNSFLKGYQLSDNYYMPVTFRDIHAKTETSYIDSKGNKRTKSYLDTSRRNINSVRAVLVDIDCHSDFDLPNIQDLNHLASSINYYAEGLGIAPTAIINSGRGVQLIYVLERPLFRNRSSVDKLLKTFQNTLINIIDKDILPNVAPLLSSESTDGKTSQSFAIKCDRAINPINQKMRCPGTLNYRAGSYAHVVVLNENCVYNAGDFLGEQLGDYNEYLKVKKKTKAKKREKKRKGITDRNSKNNLAIYYVKRIEAIKKAMLHASETIGTGFRNNGYFSIVWQMIGLMEVSDSKFKCQEDIASEIYEFDASLSSSYFKNYGAAVKFVESARKSREKSLNTSLSNKAIEDYCIALNIAHEDGIDLEPFFTPTVRETRIEKQERRAIKDDRLLKRIKNQVLDCKTIMNIADDCNVARNTIYDRLKAIAKELGIEGFKDTVKGLYAVIRKALIDTLVSAKKKDSCGDQIKEINVLHFLDLFHTTFENLFGYNKFSSKLSYWPML